MLILLLSLYIQSHFERLPPPANCEPASFDRLPPAVYSEEPQVEPKVEKDLLGGSSSSSRFNELYSLGKPVSYQLVLLILM